MSRSILCGAALVAALTVITSSTLAEADRGDRQRSGNPRVIQLELSGEARDGARASPRLPRRQVDWTTQM